MMYQIYPLKKRRGIFRRDREDAFARTDQAKPRKGEADVEKADLIAKDIGDHQLADEVR